MNKKTKIYYLHCVIAYVLLFALWSMPPIGPITPMGMKVVAILACVLYLWTTVDTIWPSFLGIVLLGFSGYAPMNQVIAKAFGNPTAILLMYVIILTGAISEAGICEYISRWFVTRKVINGRPWVFSLMLLAGVYLLATLTMATATILMFWPILYSVFKLLGIDKKDKYATIMLIAVVMVSTLSFASTPFKSILPGLLNSFQDVTGESIQYLPYMAVGTAISVVSILVIVGMMKYIFKPDVSKLQNVHVDMFNQNPLPKMNMKQRLLCVILGVFILWMLLPSILPEGAVRTFLQDTQNIAPLFGITLGGMIKLNGEPIIHFPKITAKYMLWPVFLMVGSSNAILNALTDKTTGITAFLEMKLMPMFEGRSIIVFMVLIMIMAIVLSNLCNNIVVAMLFIPIIHLFAMQNEISAIPMAMMMLFSVCLGMITPASSALGAAMHSNQEWLQVKDMYKYGFIMTAVVMLLACVIGIPLATMIFR
ncbi:MAG: SLC13 family permease [Cellulosilyticaceae bacterium]